MKKCIVIYNPNSGKVIKKDFQEKFEKILNSYDYEVFFYKTQYKNHAEEIVLKIDICDLVISIGGDGTFNEVMSGNIKREKQLPVSHIPVGTANDIGAMFGYSKNIYKNLKLLLNGQNKKIDICMINNQTFVYVAGFGKFVNISYETPRHLKKKYGYLAYLIQGLKDLKGETPLYNIEYTIDDKKYSGKFSFILISNANRIAGIDNFYKNIKLDDGVFEVLLCDITTKKEIIKSLYYLTTKDITKVPGFHFYKTDNIKLDFKKKPNKGWSIDGEELIDNTNLFEVKVIHDIEIRLPIKNIKKLFVN